MFLEPSTSSFVCNQSPCQSCHVTALPRAILAKQCNQFREQLLVVCFFSLFFWFILCFCISEYIIHIFHAEILFKISFCIRKYYPKLVFFQFFLLYVKNNAIFFSPNRAENSFSLCQMCDYDNAKPMAVIELNKFWKNQTMFAKLYVRTRFEFSIRLQCTYCGFQYE